MESTNKAPGQTQGPIHRLATETLSHIFSFCPPSPEALLRSSWSARKTEFVALKNSHVSRHWRAVSHSTPLLWRTISIRDPWFGKYGVDDELLDRYVDRIEHYLELSGNAPLEIILTDFPYPDEFLDKFTIRALDRLMAPISYNSDRWGSFHAHLYGPYFADILYLHEFMPMLTELCLEVEYLHEEGEAFVLTADKFPKSTPKLQRLSLSCIHLTDAQHLSQFTSASPVRYILVSGVKFEEAGSVMNAASADTTLELCYISFNGEVGDAHRCSSQTLKMITPRLDPEEEGNPLSIFFKNLTLEPSVKALEFTLESGEVIPFPLEAFKSVLTRSSSTAITNLSLRFVHISDTRFLNLLAVLPSLTHLAFEEHAAHAKFPVSKGFRPPPPLSNGFFDSLAISDHETDDETFVLANPPEEDVKLDNFDDGKPFDRSLCPLLPQLTDLTLVFRNSLITEHFVAMMKSRILSTSHSNDDSNVTRIAPLQRVCLQYTDHRLPDESTQAELLKLTGSEGLTLTIRRAANPK